MIDKRKKTYQAFSTFVSGLVNDLNALSADGWSILVEGQRDARAMRSLGYHGQMATISAVGLKGARAFGGSTKVVIMTDLDHEGSVLAARYMRRLSHDGLKTSLVERRRLKAASKGVFLHVENLSRFAYPGIS